jgi:hypothetical protein
MPVKRISRGQPENDDESLGLMANGSSGQWEVAVDETTAGPDRWFVQIEGPTVYFSFEIPSPEVISEALEYFGGRSSPKGPLPSASAEKGPLVIGQHRQTPVILVRDEEYKDRYFLKIGPEADPVMWFTVAGEDLKDIQEALRQAAEDLEDNG